MPSSRPMRIHQAVYGAVAWANPMKTRIMGEATTPSHNPISHPFIILDRYHAPGDATVRLQLLALSHRPPNPLSNRTAEIGHLLTNTQGSFQDGTLIALGHILEAPLSALKRPSRKGVQVIDPTDMVNIIEHLGTFVFYLTTSHRPNPSPDPDLGLVPVHAPPTVPPPLPTATTAVLVPDTDPSTADAQENLQNPL
ncbi:hypothetical protein BJ165DRAFT_1535245 [Panaeolus papilionaceus]|nr:hypothetical protein BJ165DRAFT_1535245 [Panaeolus papilionaceus]